MSSGYLVINWAKTSADILLQIGLKNAEIDSVRMKSPTFLVADTQ